MGIQPRSISPEVQELVNLYKTQVNAAPVTAADIMAGAEYQDLARGIQYQSDKAYAGMLKDHAARGAYGSKQAGLASAEMRGAFEAQKAGLIPQLLAAEQARRQQQLQNTGNLLNTVSGLQNTAFNQGVTEFNTMAPYTMLTAGQRQQGEQFQQNFNRGVLESDRAFGITEAGVTGQYQPQAVQQLLQAVVNAKRSYGNDNDGTTAAQDNANANAARAALAGYGYTPEQIEALVGSGVTLEQAQANIGRFTMPTMQARATEAQMFGTYGGQPTLQGQAAQQGLAMGNLQYQVAADPTFGLAAQAQADIANTQSLIADRNKPPASQQPKPKTPDQIRTERIGLLSPYDVTPTAKNVWVDLEETLNGIAAQTGGQLDRAQAGQLLQAMLNVPGVTSKDKGFIAAMFASYFGDSEASSYLQTFMKGYKAPEEDPLTGLGL